MRCNQDAHCWLGGPPENGALCQCTALAWPVEGSLWECERCDGCGWYEGSGFTKCAECGGSGVVARTLSTAPTTPETPSYEAVMDALCEAVALIRLGVDESHGWAYGDLERAIAFAERWSAIPAPVPTPDGAA